MQAALEITLRYCHKETEQYGRCVAANPSSWQQDCHQLKLDMAKCTSSHPIVQKIRQDCAEPFTAFEQCLKTNQSSSIKCSEHLQKFLLCADQPSFLISSEEALLFLEVALRLKDLASDGTSDIVMIYRCMILITITSLWEAACKKLLETSHTKALYPHPAKSERDGNKVSDCCTLELPPPVKQLASLP